MYERIVVPLDGSMLAEKALPDAEQLARLTSAPVHLVRVIDLGDLVWHGQSGWVMEHTAAEHALAAESTAASSYLETIAERLVGTGLVVETEVGRGQPSREVIAATRPGDLIVMASHGRSGMPRWFLGSVAEEVLRHATVPILLVRTDTATDPPVVAEAAAHANGDPTLGGAIAPDAAVARSRALRLLDKDLYSPEEASYLLGIPKGAIFQAAFAKRLTAEIVGHNVISIRRDDLLRWIEGGAHPGSTVEPTGHEPAAVE